MNQTRKRATKTMENERVGGFRYHQLPVRDATCGTESAHAGTTMTYNLGLGGGRRDWPAREIPNHG